MNFKKDILKVFILVLIICILFGSVTYKPDIHTATYEELCTIKGIGSVLSERTLSYLTQYPDAEIEDLLNVDGIGPERLKMIDKEYK